MCFMKDHYAMILEYKEKKNETLYLSVATSPDIPNGDIPSPWCPLTFTAGGRFSRCPSVPNVLTYFVGSKLHACFSFD